MNIKEIEAMRESDIAEMAEEAINIKGHRVYFADLGERFGYSALVCSEGEHLYHADDFELHHPKKSREELRDWYIKAMGSKLFTESELASPCPDYDEEGRRKYYLSNLYSMKRPYISMFHIGNRNPAIEEDIKEMYPSYVAYAYYWDEDFVKRMSELHRQICSAVESGRSPEYMEQAFCYEMSNHEYGYAMDKDYEVISVFERIEYIPYGSTEQYLAETDWCDEWKAAYRRAREKQLEFIETL